MMEGLHDPDRPPMERKYNVIKHEQEKSSMQSMMLSCAASGTTKKIVENSL